MVGGGGSLSRAVLWTSTEVVDLTISRLRIPLEMRKQRHSDLNRSKQKTQRESTESRHRRRKSGGGGSLRI